MKFGGAHDPRMFAILTTAFLIAAGSGLIVPAYPILVQSFVGRNPSETGYHYGMLVATYSVAQFLSAPIIGQLSDRFGRRPILLLAMAGFCVHHVIAALAPSLAWLYIARVIAGACGGSIAAIGAYIADITPPEKRAQSFGTVWGTSNVGRMIGPVVGGMLTGLGSRTAFWGAAVMSACNFFYCLFILPESRPKALRGSALTARFNPIAFISEMRRLRLPAGLVAGFALSICAASIAQPILLLIMRLQLGWTGKRIGLYITLVALATVIGQVALTRLFLPLMGDRRALSSALLLRSIGWLATAFVAVSWQMYALLVFALLGSIVQPLMGAFFSRAVPSEGQGQLQGVMNSLALVAEACGPVVGGAVYRYFTEPSSPVVFSGAPFILSSLLGLATLLCTMSALPARPKKDLAVAGYRKATESKA